MYLNKISRIVTRALFVSGLIFVALTNIVSAADTIKPVITLSGASSVSVPMSISYVDTGATALDDVDRDITSSIVIVNPVNMSIPGVYIITYNVSDAATNAADEVTRTVTVFDDIPPLINITIVAGNDPTVVRVDNPYIEQGATAADNVDGDVSGDIIIAGTVDTSVLGVYTITYDVSDSESNVATQRVRTVYVVGDAVSSWTLPTSGTTYPYGDTVTYSGAWELPPEWVASIDLYIEKDGVVSLLETIEVDSIGETSVTTGTFTYNVPGPLASGDYTASVSSDAGVACALDTPSTCSFDGDIRIAYGYGSRIFTVGPAPDPILSVTPSADPAYNFLGAVVGSTPTERSFFLENTGSQQAVGTVSIPGGSQYSCVSGCSYDLGPTDGLWEVKIAFTPADLTPNVAEVITFPCDNVLCPDVMRNVIGTGSSAPFPPELDYSMSGTDFGFVNIGDTRTYVLTISNIGGGVLTESVTFSSAQYSCLSSCNYSVSSGDSTNITVVFTPTLLGDDAAQMFVGPTETVNITGFGNGGPLVTILPSTIDFGSVNLDSTSSTIFVNIINTGLGLLSGSINGLPSSEFLCVSGCSYSGIAPGDFSHFAEIVFTPTITPGLRSAFAEFANTRGDIVDSVFLAIDGFANNSPIVQLSCASVAATGSECFFAWSAQNYRFGVLPVGISSGNRAVITITNSGLGTLTGSLVPQSGDPWEFVCIDCSVSLGPGVSKDILVEFTPPYDTTWDTGGVNRAWGDQKSVMFEFRTNAGPDIPLRLYGGGFEVIVSFWERYHTGDFGNVTVSDTSGGRSKGYKIGVNENFRVNWNIPSTTATLEHPWWCKVDGGYAGCSGMFGRPDTAYNESGEIRLRFSPPALTPDGPISHFVSIDWQSVDYPSLKGTLTRPVTGYAVAEPNLAFDKYSDDTKTKDFGVVNLGSEPTLSLKVYNVGIGTLVGSPDFAAMSSDGQGAFVCDTSYATNPDCTYSVTRSPGGGDQYKRMRLKFIPTAPLPPGGVYNESLVFTGGGEGIYTLKGIGNELPLLSVFPPTPLDFGNVQTNDVASIPVRVENAGPGTLSGSVTFSPSTYFYCLDCSYSLGPGLSKIINILFKPTADGAFSSTATYTNLTNPGDPSITQSLDGVGIFSSILGVIGNSNFGNVKLGEFKEETFTIQNNSVNPITTGLFTFTNGTVFECVDPVPCELSLDPGATAPVTVRFKPIIIGLDLSIMSLTDYPLESFTLRGNGILPVKFEEI